MYKNVRNQYIKQNSNMMIKPRESGWYIVTLIIMCLMSMDFKTRFFYFAFLLFGIMILAYRKSFYIPMAMIPALVLSISICLFSNSARGWALGMIRPFAYPLCVVVGFNLAESHLVEKTGRKVIGITIALALGSYSHYIFNMILNWGKTIDRNTIDIWTKTVLSATGQSALASLMVGVCISFVFLKIKIQYRILMMGTLISIAYYNLVLGGRTLFILIIILLLFNTAVEWKANNNRKKLKLIFTILLVSMAAFCIIHFNVFGIVDEFNKSNFYMRFFAKNGGEGVTEDGRMTYKLMYLQNMYLYPFGGNELFKAIGNHYAHDIFLDTYSDAGVFALISIIIMVGCYIKGVFRIIKTHDSDHKLKVIVINVMIVYIFMFCMEPIIDGIPWLFASFCVICGAIARYNDQNNIIRR